MCGLVVLCLGPLSACGDGTGRRSRATSEAPKTWIVAPPFDTIGRDHSSGPDSSVRAARRYDSAEIEVQGDSMTVEVADPQGRSTCWQSWGGVLPGGSLPRCRLESILISEVAPGETAPWIAFYIDAPMSGTYRLTVRARNGQHVLIGVGRRYGGLGGYGGAEDERSIKGGDSASWLVDWSPTGSDSCWVHLRSVRQP
jgi:hypothetical protein